MKNRNFIALLYLLFTNTLILAQTNIPSAIINQDVTWSRLGSPYTINGNLIIDHAKLSIEPGVKIIFNSDYSIRFKANSTIYAKGTKLDSILITSTEQVHSGRFIFEDVSSSTVTQNDTLFLSGSIFSFVKFDKLGLVGGYWLNSYWESYNGNFRGGVKLLFEHCAFTNLISGKFNDPRNYSYDLISHINESIFNHCDFSKLKLGWGLIGNRGRSKVSIYHSNFSQITQNGYGPMFIQNPSTKIINSHFSDIQTNKLFAGFYTDIGDSLIIKNSSFSNITCYEQFHYVNHPVVELEKVLFQNITSPEFLVKNGLNEVYTISNSSFDQLNIKTYLFNFVNLNIQNSNFNLKDGQKISITAENPNPIASEFLGKNYWRINNQVITDTAYLHGLSTNYYNDVTRDKVFFRSLQSSPILDAPPVSKFSQTIHFETLVNHQYGDDSFDLPATATSGLSITYSSSNSTVATINGNKLSIVGAGTANITARQTGNDDYAAAEPVTQILTVEKAILTATADNKTRPYGDPNPDLTVGYSGFKYNETATVIDMVPVATTAANLKSPVGTFPISVNGGNDTNYTFAYTPATLTVTKAPLIVKADDQSRPYHTNNPSLSISYTGFKNDETVVVLDAAPVATTAATATSDVDSYPIIASGGNDHHYSFSYLPGTLTIIKAAQSISFNKQNDVQESLNTFNLNATSSSNLVVVFESSDATKLILTGAMATIKGPGLATVKASQPGNNNYEPAAEISQSFCILPVKPVITASGLGTENIQLTSSTKSNIQWFKDGQLLNGQTSPELPVNANGVYVVRCTVEGCSSDSDGISLIVTAIDKETNNDIQLFPNPVKNELRLLLPELNGKVNRQIEIMDLSGRIIQSQWLSGDELVIHVDQLSPGSYFISISGLKQKVYKRFVKW